MLALDPYYEMFPTSYRRSYPYWYGVAGTPDENKLSTGAKLGIGIGLGLGAVGVVAFALTRKARR